MFLGLLDPHPSINKQKKRKPLISTVLSLLYDFLSLKNDVNVRIKKAGSVSGSVSHKYGSEDPDPYL
jgi:hypothetical protein